MYGDSKEILISYIEDHVSACFLSNTIQRVELKAAFLSALSKAKEH